jgi:hypothetical protein
MGYYVDIFDQNFTLKKEHHEAAFKKVCELNDFDDLKRGGGGELYNQPRPEGMSYHPAKWFSWMAADYPSECKDLVEVLNMIGFDVIEDEAGDIQALYYNDKTGQEELFFSAISEYVVPGSYICWKGEDDTYWRWYFDGEMQIDAGYVTFGN